MNTLEIARKLAAGIPHGGATVAQHGHTIRRGLIVAQQPEFEHKLDFKSVQYALPEIVRWLDRVNDYVLEQTKFGLWVDDEGVIWLDLVEIIDLNNIKLAVRLAKDRNQKAVQLLDLDIGLNQTLWLECPGHE